MANTGSPVAANVATEEEFLSFYSCPVLSDNDLAWYFRLQRRFGKRSDFMSVLHAERKHFDDLPNLLLAVRNFHGKAATTESEKTHRQAKANLEIRRLTSNQKVLATLPTDTEEDRQEKDRIQAILRIFKGRFVFKASASSSEDSPTLPEDWKGRPFT